MKVYTGVLLAILGAIEFARFLTELYHPLSKFLWLNFLGVSILMLWILWYEKPFTTNKEVKG